MTVKKRLYIVALFIGLLISPTFLGLYVPKVFADAPSVYVESISSGYHFHNNLDDFYIDRRGFQISNNLTEPWADILIGANFTYAKRAFSYWTTGLSFTWTSQNLTGAANLTGFTTLVSVSTRKCNLYLNYYCVLDDAYIRITPILTSNLSTAITNVWLTIRYENITLSGETANNCVSIPTIGNVTDYFDDGTELELPANFVYNSTSFVYNKFVMWNNRTMKFAELWWDKNYTRNGVNYTSSANVRGISNTDGANGAVQVELSYGNFPTTVVCSHMFRWHDPTSTLSMKNSLSGRTTYPDYYNAVTGTVNGNSSVKTVQAADSVYLNVTAVRIGGTGDHIVNITFGSAFGTTKEIMPYISSRVVVSGSNVSVNGQFYAYNFTQNNWDTTGSMYKSSTFTTSQTYYYIYNYYVGYKYTSSTATPYWNMTVYASSPNGFLLYIDYMEFKTTYYDLVTTNSTTAASMSQNVLDFIVGMRAWYVNSSNLETELTSGTVVDLVTPTGKSETLHNNSWTCPFTLCVNYTIIRIYYTGTILLTTADPASGGIPAIFVTNMTAMNNYTLDSNQWDVYYSFYYSAFADEEYFRFGSTTYWSRVEQFKYHFPVWTSISTWWEQLNSGVVAAWHTIATWYELLTARQWNSIINWYEILNTRNWNNIATWYELLPTRIWTAITTWYELLTTRQWNNISTFYELLNARQWNAISTWYELLRVPIWNQIETWWSDLVTYMPSWNTISTWWAQLGTRTWNEITAWYELLGYVPSWHSVATLWEFLTPPREVIRYDNVHSVSLTGGLTKTHPSPDLNRSAYGESFKCNGSYYLAAAAFQIRRNGSPDGYLCVAVYVANVTGGRVYGTDANPIEPAIATSEPIAASTISNAWLPVLWYEFTFTGANMTKLSKDTVYCVELQALNGTNWLNGVNFMDVALDSGNTFDGNKNQYYSNFWYSSPAQDTQFYVYGYPVGGLPAWLAVTIIAICAIIGVGIFLFIFIMRRRKNSLIS